MDRTRPLSVVAIGVLLLLGLGAAGCSKSAKEEGHLFRDDLAPAEPQQPAGGAPKGKQDDLKTQPRKIIYTAAVRLQTDRFAKAEQELVRLVEEHQGFIIHSEVRGSTGTSRYGEWKVRVPVERFKAFHAAVVKLGELQSSNLDSQDVTEEFYDLQARIKNRQAREEALREMYKEWAKKAEKPSDLLPIKNELDGLRLEIEREQGRLKLLARLTEMTTVTVVIHERGAYVPPEALTFEAKAGRTWGDSLEALLDLGRWLVLALIALAPWLPVLALVVAPLWILARRARRQAAARIPVAAVPAPAEPPPPVGQ